MSAPRRTNDDYAIIELMQLQGLAKLADGQLWLKAAEMIRDERVTAKQAAQTLKVSEPTLWRRIKPWTEYLAQGPGYGP